MAQGEDGSAADAFRKALIFPLIVVATPPTFVGDWLARSLFAIE